ncbi:MAG: translation initiation factor IF-2 [Patescibacteria group bacterium]
MIKITKSILTVRELATILQKSESEILFRLLKEGLVTSINDNLDLDTILLISDAFGVEIEYDANSGNKNLEDESLKTQIPLSERLAEIFENEKEYLKPRPPIVTVMGHVDHGKTTLLDRIRTSRVAEKEAGGITQSIGAYQVKTKNGLVTFIDTPGHEAFSSMRERGSSVTDVIILVVAANDGVRDQTREVINLAKANNIPIIVAMNKIDLDNANPDKTKDELSKEGLIPEEWGGTTQVIPISAKKGIGIDELLEMTALITDLKELKANPDGETIGVIIESSRDSKKGVLVTAIILNGTLKVGDNIRAGNHFAKVRFLENHFGKQVSFSLPASPVRISGFKDVPEVGDRIEISEIGESRSSYAKTIVVKSIKDSEVDYGKSKLSLIIKADTEGSLEALETVIESLSTENVKIFFSAKGVGQITENDIRYAESIKAHIIGFNVSMSKTAEKSLKSSSSLITVLTDKIIYRLSERVQKAIQVLSMPDEIETISGELEVLKVFRSDKKEVLLGGKVKQGKIGRKERVFVISGTEKIASGIYITSLKMKNVEVDEVKTGDECGLVLKINGIENEIKEGFIIRASKTKRVDKTNPFRSSFE